MACYWLGCSTWEECIGQYSSRRLTKETDLMRAVQGLADAFSQRLGQRYLAGVFISQLPGQLLWARSLPPVNRPPLQQRFPSWSWASFRTCVYFPLDGESVEPNKTYVEHRVDEDGSLAIFGERPLVNWSVRQRTPEDERTHFGWSGLVINMPGLLTMEAWLIEDELGTTIGVALPDYRVPAADSIVILQLLQDKSCRRLWELLLSRSQESPWAYERIGVAFIDLDLLNGPWFSGGDECVGTFIV